jgi:tetratricopeptide (TPR) repeat protein
MRALRAFFLIAGVLASQPKEPSLADALALMQSNDLAGAVKLLESITAREPKNGRAWRNLGLAHDRLKDPEHAIAAYRQALDVQPETVAPTYNIAVDYALLKNSDLMFEWLAKAKATKRIDMSQAAEAPELAAYKSDPRFAAILPQPSDFENPFVETVQIIREWRGEAANDQFGWIARAIGDVDGDGVADFVTSAPTSNAGG